MIKRMVDNYYLFRTDKDDDFDVETLGKWMFFFLYKNQEFALEMCEKAINEGICVECKCSDRSDNQGYSCGVVCLYCSDKLEEHKKVIQFMIDNELIRKTNSDRLFNIMFKYSERSKYGRVEGFNLSKIMDLYSGEWLN